MADISKLEQMLKKIKSHRTPPFLESDPYFCREPWRKFGAYFDGYGWFCDEHILSQATEKDIQIAYDEIMGVNKCQS
jgi:hypothetical protein